MGPLVKLFFLRKVAKNEYAHANMYEKKMHTFIRIGLMKK